MNLYVTHLQPSEKKVHVIFLADSVAKQEAIPNLVLAYEFVSLCRMDFQSRDRLCTLSRNDL